MVHAIVLRVMVFFFLLSLLAFILFVIFLHYFFVNLSDSLVWDPLVIAPVEGLVMDVVLVRGLILFSGGIIIYNMKWKMKKKK